MRVTDRSERSKDDKLHHCYIGPGGICGVLMDMAALTSTNPSKNRAVSLQGIVIKQPHSMRFAAANAEDRTEDQIPRQNTN